MGESEIKKEIMDNLLKMPEIHVFKVWCGNIVAKHGARITGARNGTPDICGFFRSGPNAGRFLGIETKQPKAGYRPEQYEFMIEASRAGAVVFGAVSWKECKMRLEVFL